MSSKLMYYHDLPDAEGITRVFNKLGVECATCREVFLAEALCEAMNKDEDYSIVSRIDQVQELLDELRDEVREMRLGRKKDVGGG